MAGPVERCSSSAANDVIDFTGWAISEHADGRTHRFHTDGDDRAGLVEALADVRAAILLPHTTDDHNHCSWPCDRTTTEPSALVGRSEPR